MWPGLGWKINLLITTHIRFAQPLALKGSPHVLVLDDICKPLISGLRFDVIEAKLPHTNVLKLHRGLVVSKVRN
jgi:hypothetical protein